MAGGRCRPGDEECGQRKRREQRKRYLDGTGPIAAIMVFVIDKIYESIKIIWNIFVDMTTDIVTWIYDVIFSDFKGVLGTNGEGYCFDLFMTRTFITIFIPPMGVFLAKGLYYGWWNILISAIMCIYSYWLGMIYSFIIISNNQYADHLENHENRIAEQRRKEIEEETGKSYKKQSATTLIVFFVTIAFFLYLIRLFLVGGIKIFS